MYPGRTSVRPSPAFDPGVAHPARVYNYWLGGKDHYEADRAAGDEVARCRPRHPGADLYAGIARTRPSTPASTTRLGILIG